MECSHFLCESGSIIAFLTEVEVHPSGTSTKKAIIDHFHCESGPIITFLTEVEVPRCGTSNSVKKVIIDPHVTE